MRKVLSGICILAISFFVGCSSDGDGDGDAGSTSVTFDSASGLCEVLSQGDVFLPVLLSMGADGSWPLPEFRDIVAMTAEEINAGGGIDGKTLGVFLCDSKCQVSDGETSMKEIIEFRKANPGKVAGVAVGPSCSTVAMNEQADKETDTLFEMAKAENMILIAGTTESYAITTADKDNYFFRTIGHGELQGGAQAGYLSGFLGLDALKIVAVDDAWGKGMADAVKKYFDQQTSADAATIYAYKKDATEAADLWSAEALSYIDAGVGTFLLGYDGDTEFQAFFKGMSTHPWTNEPTHVELSNSFTSEFFTAINLKDFMTGKGGITPMAVSNDSSKYWEQAYKTRTGKDSTNYLPQTYDALYMAAIGIALAADPTDGADIRGKLLSSTKSGNQVGPGNWAAILTEVKAGSLDYVGASGPIDFDAEGDVSSYFQHQVFTADGGFANCGCWLGDGTNCAADVENITACTK